VRLTELRQLMLAEAPRVLAALTTVLGAPGSGDATACLALECARTWVTWVPLELVLAPAPSLLDTLFTWLRHERGRALAAECLSEILTRPWVPTQPGPRARLMEVFDQGAALTCALAAAPPATLAELNEDGGGGFLLKAT
jgi:hypothetical protein